MPDGAVIHRKIQKKEIKDDKILNENKKIFPQENFETELRYINITFKENCANKEKQWETTNVTSN